MARVTRGGARGVRCPRGMTGAVLSEIGLHSGYYSFLPKQKGNSGSVTATFRDQIRRRLPLSSWLCVPLC